MVRCGKEVLVEGMILRVEDGEDMLGMSWKIVDGGRRSS